jgi:hypothetical protein
MDNPTMIITISVALITAVFGPVAVAWAQSKFTKSTKETTISEAINMNVMVDSQLEDMMDELKCDRIWIAQFHNGGHFYPTGKSIQKFSVFYEKLTLNTPSLQALLQNIPASLFPRALNKMHRDRELSVPVVQEGEELYGMESITLPLNTKSLYMVGLYSLDNHLIGVMGIAYNEKQHQLTHEEWVYTRQKIGVIGTLLTEYLYTNNIKK